MKFYKPGSDDLFNSFREKLTEDCDLYVLKKHGVFVGGCGMLKAFGLLEEFEITCKTFLALSNMK